MLKLLELEKLPGMKERKKRATCLREICAWVEHLNWWTLDALSRLWIVSLFQNGREWVFLFEPLFCPIHVLRQLALVASSPTKGLICPMWRPWMVGPQVGDLVKTEWNHWTHGLFLLEQSVWRNRDCVSSNWPGSRSQVLGSSRKARDTWTPSAGKPRGQSLISPAERMKKAQS